VDGATIDQASPKEVYRSTLDFGAPAEGSKVDNLSGYFKNKIQQKSEEGRMTSTTYDENTGTYIESDRDDSLLPTKKPQKK
jgi:hypothetical protein